MEDQTFRTMDNAIKVVKDSLSKDLAEILQCYRSWLEQVNLPVLNFNDFVVRIQSYGSPRLKATSISMKLQKTTSYLSPRPILTEQL